MCLTFFFLLRDLFFTCFASFYYLVIHSILFHYIHAFIWISCAPLIILDHLYVFQVKLSSFLYPLSIMTKRGRNCGEYVVSFFKILHVRGRNTFLCKEEMCFILGGVLTSLFLYTGLVTIYRHTLYLFSLLYCWCMFFSHLPFHVLFLFYIYTNASYYLYAIYYLCFIQRCFDEFCLKCFRNTGCQTLLAINSLLAKFFKSLC